jgi:hypothetical protein
LFVQTSIYFSTLQREFPSIAHVRMRGKLENFAERYKF